MIGSSHEIYTLALTVVVAALLSRHDAEAASFDCRAATTTVEHMICADAHLSEQDERIANAYWAAVRSAKQPDTIRATQRRWLSLLALCSEAACIDAAQQMRLSQLGSQPSSLATHLTQVGEQIGGGGHNTVTAIAVRDLGGRHAAIDVRFTEKDAIDFCQGHGGERVATRSCIAESMAEFGTETELRADCQRGTFSVFGTALAFLGRNAAWTSDSIEEPEYLIKDLVSGDILPEANVSGYPLDLESFQRLCPGVVEQAPRVRR